MGEASGKPVKPSSILSLSWLPLKICASVPELSVPLSKATTTQGMFPSAWVSSSFHSSGVVGHYRYSCMNSCVMTLQTVKMNAVLGIWRQWQSWGPHPKAPSSWSSWSVLGKSFLHLHVSTVSQGKSVSWCLCWPTCHLCIIQGLTNIRCFLLGYIAGALFTKILTAILT